MYCNLWLGDDSSDFIVGTARYRTLRLGDDSVDSADVREEDGSEAGEGCTTINGGFTCGVVKAFTPTYEHEIVRRAATPITMCFMVSAFTLAFLSKTHEDSAQ